MREVNMGLRFPLLYLDEETVTSLQDGDVIDYTVAGKFSFKRGDKTLKTRSSFEAPFEEVWGPDGMFACPESFIDSNLPNELHLFQIEETISGKRWRIERREMRAFG